MRLDISSATSLQTAIGVIREEFATRGFLRVTLGKAKARSLDQNAISHAWYEQLARELREDDATGWKCYCKLHHGVPILRTEDDDFRAAYDASIKGMSYAQKLQVMRILPVTSLMTTKQLSAYMEEVKKDFWDKHRVDLVFPMGAAA